MLMQSLKYGTEQWLHMWPLAKTEAGYSSACRLEGCCKARWEKSHREVMAIVWKLNSLVWSTSRGLDRAYHIFHSLKRQS